MGDQPTPAYLIANLNVKDQRIYVQRYGIPSIKILEQYGAEVLAASADAQTLEGERDGNWTVILRFPSMERAEAFYTSSEYAPFRSLRLNELTNGGTLILVDGFSLKAAGP